MQESKKREIIAKLLIWYPDNVPDGICREYAQIAYLQGFLECLCTLYGKEFSDAIHELYKGVINLNTERYLDGQDWCRDYEGINSLLNELLN